LRTRTGLAGRRAELNLLTDWIARLETVGHARVFSLVAIGGQGKSALSWHWFNSVSRTGQVCTSRQKIWQEWRDVPAGSAVSALILKADLACAGPELRTAGQRWQWARTRCIPYSEFSANTARLQSQSD